MNKKFVKLSSLLITTSIIASLFTGCGNSSKSADSSTDSSMDSKSDTTIATTQQTSEASYPLKTDVKLKYLGGLNWNVSANFKNLGDTPFAKELEKKTGIKVEYIHPAAGQEKDSINLLIASGDLPDLMEYNWLNDYVGGPEAAISNNVILKLNDIFDEYAPNLKNYLQSNTEINKMVKTDNGSYYVFPFVRGDSLLLTTYGLAMRSDWLKDLGLQTPTTIDEWYTTLKAFKEKKNAAAPFSYIGSGDPLSPYKSGLVIGAFGVKREFFVEDGKVKYGPYEKGYKDFLVTMNKWFAEGLLDNNFATNDSKAIDANILNGQTGVTGLAPGSGIGKYVPALKEKDPNADMVAIPYPVLNKGDKPKFSSQASPYDGVCSVAISAKTKNIEIAAKWLDYGYSEEGNLLYNFGVEGISYKIENGYPKMTNEVLANPDKLPTAQAWSKYARGNYSGPFVQRKEYLEQYYTLQQQVDALKVWSDTDAAKYLIPPVSPTQEEGTQFAKVMTDVNSYVDEFSLKVIMGTESIDNFNKYIEQLKKLGMDKAIEIKQSAFNRYENR